MSDRIFPPAIPLQTLPAAINVVQASNHGRYSAGPVWRGLAIAGVVLTVGCGSTRNDAQREAYAKANGLIKENCVNSCMADTGGDPVDCDAAEEGLEFFDVDIVNFDGPASGAKATNMFAYDDASDAFRSPSNGWEPPSVTYPEDDDLLGEPEEIANSIRIAQRCTDKESNGVLHLYGGPFIGYGGGMGITLGKLLQGNCTGDEDTVPTYCNPEAEFPDYEFDLTEWDGLSFWARRGPESQTVLRVGAGEKHTDDDLSYMATYNELNDTGGSTVKHCERFRECGCRNRKPCSLFKEPENVGGGECMVCYDPETDPAPPSCKAVREGTAQTRSDGSTRGDGQYEVCGQTVCDEINKAFDGNGSFGGGADPQFNGKPCTPHYMQGGAFRESCFDPDEDPPPPEPNDQCGDSPFRPVTLSGSWRFFKVRFEDLAQQGWAKESFWMDIDKLTSVRLTFDRGWIDYWIDDLRFYREAK